jgi:hypothetical protein
VKEPLARAVTNELGSQKSLFCITEHNFSGP